MTRIHRTRTRHPAAAKREAARIVALIDAATYVAACEAQAIDDAEWMVHPDPFTTENLAPDFGAESREIVAVIRP